MRIRESDFLRDLAHVFLSVALTYALTSGCCWLVSSGLAGLVAMEKVTITTAFSIASLFLSSAEKPRPQGFS